MGVKPKDDDDDEAKAAAAKEQADELRRMVVGTVKEQVAKAMGKLDIGKLVTDAVTPLLEGLKPAEGGAGAGAGGQGGQQQAGALSPEVKAQIDALAKQNKALQDKYDAAERARADTEAKSRRKEERDTLGGELRKAGVPEALVPAAVAMLHGDKGVIKRNDEGGIVWAQGDDALEVSKGIAGWIKSDEGKAFLPPRGAAGSGAGRSGAAGANGQRGGVSKDQQILDDLSFLAGGADFGAGGGQQ